MISKHCGQRLKQILPHAVGYRMGEHQWKCVVCQRIFSQRTRQPLVRASNFHGVLS